MFAISAAIRSPIASVNGRLNGTFYLKNCTFIHINLPLMLCDVSVN